MHSVAIVDTSIFCNVLNLPNMNADRKEVIRDMEEFIKNRTSLLLPMASVYETGNHVAQLNDGNIRRRFAEIFVKQVKKAMTGEAPWRTMQFPTQDELSNWLNKFPDEAMRGAGIGDISIINEWEKFRTKTPDHRVFIWSIDKHLRGYDSHPQRL